MKDYLKPGMKISLADGSGVAAREEKEKERSSNVEGDGTVLFNEEGRCVVCGGLAYLSRIAGC